MLNSYHFGLLFRFLQLNLIHSARYVLLTDQVSPPWTIKLIFDGNIKDLVMATSGKAVTCSMVVSRSVASGGMYDAIVLSPKQTRDIFDLESE